MPEKPFQPVSAFQRVTQRATLRYAIRINQMGKPIEVIIIRLEVPRFTTANRMKEMLNRKVFDYIKQAYPGMLQMGAVVLGRVDKEIE